MSRLHEHVLLLTNDFISKIFASRPTSFGPTITEVTRIQRAFYLFETYRLLYSRRRCEQWGYYERNEFWQGNDNIKFGVFSPWEMEQIHCIYDYLLNLVSPGQHFFFCVASLS